MYVPAAKKRHMVAILWAVGGVAATGRLVASGCRQKSRRGSWMSAKAVCRLRDVC